MTTPKFATQLNNYFQEKNGGDTSPISYQESSSGPADAPTWTIIFSGVEKGRGSALTKNAAREEASKKALEALTGRAL
ncbi:hypothetical protein K435DRAFT_849048 [Dendrothele bispora CBS 962.96]|uniref:DRBM domain-containing protein n=1 Tax=Dendrothele bispora (strain CBS 962.96) TaxID=1314807 RepID=A0A4S8MTR9_DENBC|nr:hypothetical protein K435DRAFT_849048 [Dendrothele bispora CBS 962.96]